MLVVFKSAPILKRSLRVKHPVMQLYILKLLKMQTKYLGRQWRKANMKTMSAIYQKVRHRLTDDWAYGNGEWFDYVVSVSSRTTSLTWHSRVGRVLPRTFVLSTEKNSRESVQNGLAIASLFCVVTFLESRRDASSVARFKRLAFLEYLS